MTRGMTSGLILPTSQDEAFFFGGLFFFGDLCDAVGISGPFSNAASAWRATFFIRVGRA